MWQPTPPLNIEFKKKTWQENVKIALFIYQIGQSNDLRSKSKRVSVREIKSRDFQAKIRYLKKCLVRYRKLTGKGRGIAGVQVGIPDQLIAIWMPEIKRNIFIAINPRIIKKSAKQLKYPEMCMSAQPLIAPVARPAWIEFEYYDEQGKKQLWNTKADDQLGVLYNRVFQHEIDHLKGIINIDRVKSKELIYESSAEFYKNAQFEEVDA